MKYLIAGCVTAFAVSVFAVPTLTDVSVVESGNHIVTISYKLENEPAVVTVDIQTNALADATGAWASIGGENITPSLSGDIGVVVDNGDSVHTAFWRPNKSWPGHRFENGTAKAVLTAWPTNAPPTFMVVDLRAGVTSRLAYYADKRSIPGGISNDLYRTTSMLFRKIPAAGIKWRMGTSAGEAGIYHRSSGSCAEDAHNVTLTEDYYMAVYMTTGKQHAMVAARAADYSLSYTCFNNNVSDACLSSGKFTAAEEEMRPVDRCSYVSLRGAQASYNWPTDGHSVTPNGFFGVLRRMGGIEFDLPTEAQWEYAARAGTSTQAYYGKTTTYAWGMNVPYINDYAWCYSNCQVGGSAVTHPVGLLLPNDFDLYDVMGNVYEACLDAEGAYSTEDQVDPKGPTVSDTSSLKRIVRGGQYANGYQFFLTSSYRASYNPNNDAATLWGSPYYGFRVWAPAVAVKQ